MAGVKMCVICRNEYHGKEQIDCSWCTSLTHIPVILGLKEIVCRGCTSLTGIPVIPDLKEIDCRGCTSLTNILAIPGLKMLDCSWCTSLTYIPDIPGLEILWCSGCTSLTCIPVIPGLEKLCCVGCPWIEQNPDFQLNLSRLITLQRWVRKDNKLRILKKWMNTEEFAMWYYHPKNPGGLRQKAKMRNLFETIKNSRI